MTISGGGRRTCSWSPFISHARGFSRIVSRFGKLCQTLAHLWSASIDDEGSINLRSYRGSVSSFRKLILGRSATVWGWSSTQGVHESHYVGMSYRNGISRDYDRDVDSNGTLDGLDAFGRVTDISFEHNVNGQALHYQYAYDKRGNNQFARVDHQGADRSWLYEYDDLNRLVRASRGELNAAGDGFAGGTPETTRWCLDPLGNWSDGDGDRSVIWFDDPDGDGHVDLPGFLIFSLFMEGPQGSGR
jgi:hypothetical protein